MGLILEGRIVKCSKCKKYGPFEEMSPYQKGWFIYKPYNHKDCGGELLNVFCKKYGLLKTADWNHMSPEEREQAIQEDKEIAVRLSRAAEQQDQQRSATPTCFNETKYLDNCLTCPMCGSHVVKKLTTAERAVSVAAWGLASGKIGKQYECKDCGHKW